MAAAAAAAEGQKPQQGLAATAAAVGQQSQQGLAVLTARNWKVCRLEGWPDCR